MGRDVSEVRKTVGLLLTDPFADIDGYLKRLERYAELGIEIINISPQCQALPDPPTRRNASGTS